MVRNRSAQTLVKIKIFYKYKILIISVKKNKFIKNKKQIPNFFGYWVRIWVLGLVLIPNIHFFW